MLPYETKETLMKVEGVSKKYDIPILSDISFEIKNIVRPDVKQGQIVSLIGKSGSGKSTLFRILSGIETPDKGTIKLCSGVKTEAEPEGEMRNVVEGQIGVVFQNSYIYEWRKVKSILKDAASICSKRTGANVILVDQITQHLDIEKLMEKWPHELSGGQRQRVAIAEQIIIGNEFILLDEPFSGLDTLAIDKVTDILIRISQSDERRTMILVSHDLSNSLAISDKAFILARKEGLEGATITHELSLAAHGLAWQKDIKENPLFRDLLKQVKSLL